MNLQIINIIILIHQCNSETVKTTTASTKTEKKNSEPPSKTYVPNRVVDEPGKVITKIKISPILLPSNKTEIVIIPYSK